MVIRDEPRLGAEVDKLDLVDRSQVQNHTELEQAEAFTIMIPSLDNDSKVGGP